VFNPHVIISFASEVASLKVEEIFSQEVESLHPLRLSPKLSSHNYVLNDDYNQSSEFTDISQWVNFILGNRSLVYCIIIIYFKFKRSFLCTLTLLILTHAGNVSLQMTALEEIYFLLSNT